MFQSFSGEAREVVARAQGHAQRLSHEWTGCEHVLLAVAESATRAGARLRDAGAQPDALEKAIGAEIGISPESRDTDTKVTLATLGINLDEVRQAVEATSGPYALDLARTARPAGARHQLRRRQASCVAAPAKPPFTPKAKRCFSAASREALRLNHGQVGIDDIALALLARDDTAAWKVLLRVKAVPGALR